MAKWKKRAAADRAASEVKETTPLTDFYKQLEDSIPQPARAGPEGGPAPQREQLKRKECEPFFRALSEGAAKGFGDPKWKMSDDEVGAFSMSLANGLNNMPDGPYNKMMGWFPWVMMGVMGTGYVVSRAAATKKSTEREKP